MSLMPWRHFQACVDRYRGDVKTHALTTREFFNIMAFAQITGRESLRETFYVSMQCLLIYIISVYHVDLYEPILLLPITGVTGKSFTMLQNFLLQRQGRFIKHNHWTFTLMLVYSHLILLYPSTSINCSFSERA